MENFERSTQSSKEKPPVLYHGSITPDIQAFEPRNRYTPGGNDVGERVYAADSPAHAAMHSFPWSSDEGIDGHIENGKETFYVPINLKARLQVPVYIYTLPSNTFGWTVEEESGHTLHSTEPVRPIGVERFETAEEAIEHFGVPVVYTEPRNREPEE